MSCHFAGFLLCYQLCLLYIFLACFWRRLWHPTSVLLPGKSHGRRSLVGCSPWGREEQDTTERSLSLFTFMHWRRKWQPTPVFLPRESQGWGSLVGCRLWSRTESDTTEVTQQQQQQPAFIFHNTFQKNKLKTRKKMHTVKLKCH